MSGNMCQVILGVENIQIIFLKRNLKLVIDGIKGKFWLITCLKFEYFDFNTIFKNFRAHF